MRIPRGRHEDVRKMEHDPHWSKLKNLVYRTLLSNIIEDSCSGEHPHPTAAIQLVIDRSIQEHSKRMLVGMKDTSQPDPTTQHRSSEAPAPQPLAPQRSHHLNRSLIRSLYRPLQASKRHRTHRLSRILGRNSTVYDARDLQQIVRRTRL